MNERLHSMPSEKLNIEVPEQSDISAIEYSAIRELEIPMELLVEELDARLANHEYAVLIGDDASGRIPTLVMRELIGKINLEAHEPAPHIVFGWV